MIRSPRAALLTATVGLWVLGAGHLIPVQIAQGQETDDLQGQELVSMEVFSEDGSISRVDIPIEAAGINRTSSATVPAEVVTLQAGGPNDNRIDLVFVGDGYTTSELGLYSSQVQNMWDRIVSYEPFAAYKDHFNVYQVNVISPESGVDGDPQGTFRDTALDMGFWCGGTERLLCVDVSKAWQYASNAPDVDQVIALANTYKYGGAGYRSSDVATVSGGHHLGGQVLVHELGHSLGNLADEYVYNEGTTYTGSEPAARNLSIHARPELAAGQHKWFRWLGEPSPDGGLVDTFEGASPGSFGIYRPTAASLMRTLGSVFNLPGRESFVLEIYQDVSPIDDCTSTGTILTGTETIFVAPVQPLTHALDITWYLDGREVLYARNDETLDLRYLPWTCQETQYLSVEVVDNTPFVREPQGRSQYLTETKTWTLNRELQVDVDIKPGEHPNMININGLGVIPVAVVGSNVLDVGQIDLTTLSFAGLQVATGPTGDPRCSVDDVAGDSHLDLVCQFADSVTDWDGAGAVASVTGSLDCGARFTGSDTFAIIELIPYSIRGEFAAESDPGSHSFWDVLENGSFDGSYFVLEDSLPVPRGSSLAIPEFDIMLRDASGNVASRYISDHDFGGLFADFFGPGSGDGFVFSNDSIQFQLGFSSGFDGTGTALSGAAFSAVDGATPGEIDVKSGTAVKGLGLPRCTILGTAGDDELKGTASDDVICGLGGNDTLEGLGGNDVLVGGPGHDILAGNDGDDRLVGDAGDDTLLGGPGHDTLAGGGGADLLRGGTGDDLLHGEDGADRLIGDDGNDAAWGGPGDDSIEGAAGNDKLRGGPGNDRLAGNSGNDKLWGQAGDDALFGGAGQDLLAGGGGADLVRGGIGSDRVHGESGPDRLIGGAGDDLMWGGPGEDLIEGRPGDDTLRGGTDNDRLEGNQGDDYLLGNLGDDELLGGAGIDTCDGGPGNNTAIACE